MKQTGYLVAVIFLVASAVLYSVLDRPDKGLVSAVLALVFVMMDLADRIEDRDHRPRMLPPRERNR